MDKPVNQDLSPFEKARKYNEEGNEYWSARDLAKILDYLEYRNFLPVIEKAKKSLRKQWSIYRRSFRAVPRVDRSR